jgi:hypothetical protein
MRECNLKFEAHSLESSLIHKQKIKLRYHGESTPNVIEIRSNRECSCVTFEKMASILGSMTACRGGRSKALRVQRVRAVNEAYQYVNSMLSLNSSLELHTSAEYPSRVAVIQTMGTIRRKLKQQLVNARFNVLKQKHLPFLRGHAAAYVICALPTY